MNVSKCPQYNYKTDNTEHKYHYSAHISSELIQFSLIVEAKLKRLNSAISSFKGGNSVIIQLIIYETIIIQL